MDDGQPTISATFATLLLDHARKLGLELPRPLSKATTPANDAQTSLDEWLALLAEIAERTHDADLPLKIGEASQVRHFGLAGYVLLSCSTLGEASRRAVRYSRLTGNVGCLQTRQHGEWAEYAFLWNRNTPPPPAMEQIWAAATASLGRWLTGRSDLQWNAHFRFPRPRDTRHYERIFQGELHFDQPSSRLRFPAWMLDLPLAMGNPALRATAEAQAEDALRSLDQEPELLRRCRLLIVRHLPDGPATLEAIAPLLGLSARTLHRRLAEHGYSFRELVDAVRLSRAHSFLCNPTMPLAEIASALGYGEQSAFQHAFKRWTGQTPGEFRAQLTARAAAIADEDAMLFPLSGAEGELV